MKPSGELNMKLTWSDVDWFCLNLSSQIKLSGFQPDMILGVARGGLIPAAMLASFLKVKDVISISIRSYTKERQRKTQPEYLHSLPEKLIKGKKILIVDDIVDSGNTFKSLNKLITPDKALAIYLSLLTKDAAKFKPHYTSFLITKSDLWITFPWEVD